MKLSTIQEAINAEIDEPVLAIRGKLSKLFSRQEGEGQYGPWTLQNGQLEADGQTIKVVFSNRDEIAGNWRNQIVELRCQKGAKGGWSGVKRTIDKRDKTPTLTITDKGEVILFKDEHQPEPQTAPVNGQTKAAGSPQDASQPLSKVMGAEPAPATQNKPPTEAERLAEGMGAMYQIMNMQLAAITFIHNYLVPAVKERTGMQLDAQQEHAWAMNVAIQMEYQKSHWHFRQKPYIFGAKPNETEPAA